MFFCLIRGCGEQTISAGFIKVLLSGNISMIYVSIVSVRRQNHSDAFILISLDIRERYIDNIQYVMAQFQVPDLLIKP